MRVCTFEADELLGRHRDALPYCERGWLTAELTAGDGRRKLEAWLEAAPAPPWPAPSQDELYGRIHAFGDFVIATFIAEVLATTALPVIEYCVANCTFDGIGIQTLGTCGAAPDTEDRPWFVVVSGAYGSADSVRAVAAHEIAHCWTLPEPTRRPWLAAQTRAYKDMTIGAIVAEAERRDAPEMVTKFCQWNAEDERKEHLAERLSRSWGYKNPWEYPDSEGAPDDENDSQV